jgi:hypothetical protein
MTFWSMCGSPAGWIGIAGSQRRSVSSSCASEKGLREVIVHARGKALVAIAFHGACRQRDDRGAPIGPARHLAQPDRRGRLEPVHLRHLAVHEDRVEGLLLEGDERLAPMARDRAGASEELEHVHGELLVHRVVLDEEHTRIELRVGGAWLERGAGRDLGAQRVHRQSCSCDWRTGRVRKYSMPPRPTNPRRAPSSSA